MPFYVPVESYFAEPVFRELVGDILSERCIRSRGIFRPEAVARLQAAARGGDFVRAKQVLSLVILELWFRRAVDRRTAG